MLFLRNGTIGEHFLEMTSVKRDSRVLFAPSRVPLIASPTPLQMVDIQLKSGIKTQLLIKREDLTATSYGGNKVRNLEFLFGDALRAGAKSLVTAGPVGSNFVAALAAHASRVNLPVTVHQFVAHRNTQIDLHDQFAKRHGARLVMLSEKLPKYLGVAAAFFKAIPAVLDRGSYYIPPGGSGVLGAYGHMNAFLEMERQTLEAGFERPQNIIVGVGTCGTMAGLLVGNAISGGHSRIIGVRCVDRMYCNRHHIAYLANSLLAKIGSELRIKAESVRLVDSPQGDEGYGRAHSQRDAIGGEFIRHGIRLDTTYTEKVALFLREFLETANSQSTLYWHTFSGAAMA